MGLNEPGFPSGQGFPTGFDPGEYFIHLFSVGDDEFQAPEIKFLENGVECRGVGLLVCLNVRNIPWPGATTSLSSKRPREVVREYRVLRPRYSPSSPSRRYRARGQCRRRFSRPFQRQWDWDLRQWRP